MGKTVTIFSYRTCTSRSSPLNTLQAFRQFLASFLHSDFIPLTYRICFRGNSLWFETLVIFRTIKNTTFRNFKNIDNFDLCLFPRHIGEIVCFIFKNDLLPNIVFNPTSNSRLQTTRSWNINCHITDSCNYPTFNWRNKKIVLDLSVYWMRKYSPFVVFFAKAISETKNIDITFP